LKIRESEQSTTEIYIIFLSQVKSKEKIQSGKKTTEINVTQISPTTERNKTTLPLGG
jgi:hypothetical protein